MELIHLLHDHLGVIASALKLTLEMVSVVCVTMGLISALAIASRKLFSKNHLRAHASTVRLQFGTWLALALEFQLGADIVATTVNPSLESLGELAILATIRTVLNFFLQKELEAEAKHQAAVHETLSAADKLESDGPELLK